MLLVPESRGGFGATWDDAYVVLRASGYYNIPLPLAEAMLAMKLLTAVGLPPMEGPVSVSVDIQGTLTAGATGATFTGALRGVPWGRDVEKFIAIIGLEGAPHVAVVNRNSAASANHAHNLAMEPRDDFHFTDDTHGDHSASR